MTSPLAVMFLAVSATCSAKSLNLAKSFANDKEASQLHGVLGEIIKDSWPLLRHLALNFIYGYACGVVTRKFLHALLLGTAAVVSLVQALAYLNWVTVNWHHINRDLARLLQGKWSSSVMTSDDGTANVDAAALLVLLTERLTVVFSQGLPSVAAFITGLTLALILGISLF